MLSQVNSSQKEKNNFCIFLTHLIALTGGFSLLLSGEGTSPGLGVSHKNTEGAHCVFLSLGLVTVKGLAVGCAATLQRWLVSVFWAVKRSPATDDKQQLNLFLLRRCAWAVNSIRIAHGKAPRLLFDPGHNSERKETQSRAIENGLKC